MKWGLLLIVLGILIGLGAMWYWALFGMSTNVGISWITTAFLPLLVGCIVSANEAGL